MNPKENGQLGSQSVGSSSSIFPNWIDKFWYNLLGAHLASSHAASTVSSAAAKPKKKSARAEKPVDTISSASASSVSPHMKDWMSHDIIQEFIKNYPVFEEIQKVLNSSTSTAMSPFDLTDAEDFSSVNMTPQPAHLQFETPIKPKISAEMSPIAHRFEVNPSNSSIPQTDCQDMGGLTTLELFKAVHPQFPMSSKQEISAGMAPIAHGFKVTTSSTPPATDFQDSRALNTLEFFEALDAQFQLPIKQKISAEMSPIAHKFEVNPTNNSNPRTDGALTTLELFKAVHPQFPMSNKQEISAGMSPIAHGFKVTTSSTPPATDFQDYRALTRLFTSSHQFFEALDAQFQLPIKPKISAEMSPIAHKFEVNTTNNSTPRTDGALTTLEIFKAVHPQFPMPSKQEISAGMSPIAHGFKMTTSSTPPATDFQDNRALTRLFTSSHQFFEALDAQFQLPFKQETSRESTSIAYGFKLDPHTSTPGTDCKDSGALTTLELYKAVMASSTPFYCQNCFFSYLYPSTPLSTNSSNSIKRGKKKTWDKHSEEYKEHRREITRRTRQRKAEKKKTPTVREISDESSETETMKLYRLVIQGRDNKDPIA